jgi:hypothetical protein
MKPAPQLVMTVQACNALDTSDRWMFAGAFVGLAITSALFVRWGMSHA